ncbi:hypothetical protein IEO21_02719 [Rhodonia placenta]|uniref:Histone-lysine N-methyltransferase, H3 lysine-79 specific n=1 Tax=Rhodonia placenta TaxID=104341 RepID=A0A8H7P770_9APHY|nr:hypothetical protein IEO21_02719 [Postia placenta]
MCSYVDFKNPDNPDDESFNPDPVSYPVTELEYPNSGASEKFILLAPRDREHYNPIMCLENTLYTMLRCYLTPAQRALFGTLPEDVFQDDASSAAPSPAITVQTVAELSPSSYPSSYVSSPPPSESESTTFNYLRLLQRAYRKRDGPRFFKVMDAINTLLRLLKYPPMPPDPFEPHSPNHFVDAVKSWTQIPPDVVTRILNETYQRAVGPRVAELSRYPAFSSTVYGELEPKLVARIIRETGLRADSLFLDLGSGVGQVVLQASLHTGCTSFGVEIMPIPADIARSQREQIHMRCRMWGVTMGEVELEENDMLKSTRVDELISKADVVLVNNKVFDEKLNNDLKSKFLDLKEGAIVVSLNPFVPSTRLSERNLDDISGIFQVTERPYGHGDVSWGSGEGSYYIHRVDRRGYTEIKTRLESRANNPRTTRSRR